ncbi:MAG: SHOCT domain-containing protein [Bacillota bacterium]
MMNMFGYGYPGWNGGWGIWMVLMMAFWIAVIVGITIFALKFIKKDQYSSNKAIEILNVKYAQGEIDEIEYMQKKKILQEK